MDSRRILSTIIALTIATSAVPAESAVVASPGHHDDGHHDTDKKEKRKAKKRKNSKRARPAAVDSAPSGVLGTAEAPRDIAVTMTNDLRFEPGTVAVHQGETIRFLIENPSVAPHDFTLGDLEAQLHHHDEMATGAGHGHDGDAADGMPGPVMLEPGETTEIIATFDEPGEILIGCHVPGHWEAGMRGAIVVMPGGAPAAA